MTSADNRDPFSLPGQWNCEYALARFKLSSGFVVCSAAKIPIPPRDVLTQNPETRGRPEMGDIKNFYGTYGSNNRDCFLLRYLLSQTGANNTCTQKEFCQYKYKSTAPPIEPTISPTMRINHKCDLQVN